VRAGFCVAFGRVVWINEEVEEVFLTTGRLVGLGECRSV
jgi:hypothetical protein